MLVFHWNFGMTQNFFHSKVSNRPRRKIWMKAVFNKNDCGLLFSLATLSLTESKRVQIMHISHVKWIWTVLETHFYIRSQNTLFGLFSSSTFSTQILTELQHEASWKKKDRKRFLEKDTIMLFCFWEKDDDLCFYTDT